MARVQCAGCGKIISDDGEPGGTYGCCDECNKHTFRSNEQSILVKDVETRPIDELAKESLTSEEKVQ